MKKFIISTILTLTTSLGQAQMLITDDLNTQDFTVHPSAILELRSNNKGLLVPRVNIAGTSDNTTISNPQMGQLIYDNTTKRLMNYSGATGWVKNIEMSDADGLIKKTKNFVTRSTAKATSNTFPSTIPNFILDSGTTGWLDLNTTLTITPTQDDNTVLINVEGMVQPNNDGGGSAFSYAIGIFVNDKLKIVRKFDREQSGSCSWNKFELTGVFYNMPKNSNQTIKVRGYNLRRGNNEISSMTYGGNANVCDNLTVSTAQIVLAAQLTE